VSDVVENLVLKHLREDSGPLRPAGRAESAAFTGESDQKLVRTTDARDAGEAGFEQVAVVISGDGGVVETSPETITSLESLFP
jgi:hypothetical protein